MVTPYASSSRRRIDKRTTCSNSPSCSAAVIKLHSRVNKTDNTTSIGCGKCPSQGANRMGWGWDRFRVLTAEFGVRPLISLSCSSFIISIRFRTEFVRSIPMETSVARGNIDTGAEPSELTSSVGEGAESEKGRQINCAAADRAVAFTCVEDDVTVQQARRNTGSLVIENLRADLDLGKV